MVTGRRPFQGRSSAETNPPPCGTRRRRSTSCAPVCRPTSCASSAAASKRTRALASKACGMFARAGVRAGRWSPAATWSPAGLAGARSPDCRCGPDLLAGAAYLGTRSGLARPFPRAAGDARHPARSRSLAALPLDNYSGDSGQDYFAEGMTDELTTQLATISRLRVIARVGDAVQGRESSVHAGDREGARRRRDCGRLGEPVRREGEDYGPARSTPGPIGICGRGASSGDRATCSRCRTSWRPPSRARLTPSSLRAEKTRLASAPRINPGGV